MTVQMLTQAEKIFFTNSEPVLVFVHIRKTAGTTLKRILEKTYHRDTIITLTDNLEFNDINHTLMSDFLKLSEYDKANIRFVRGHIQFGIHRYLPNRCEYITLLRDPVDRAVSWYYFLLQNTESSDYKNTAALCRDFDDFVEKGFIRRDTQTGQLCTDDQLYNSLNDNERLIHAKNNIDRYFTAVGLVERFEESLILFKRKLGWNHFPVYLNENVTKKRPKKEELSAETRRKILEQSGGDAQLYEYVNQRFDDEVKAMGFSFQRELETLRRLNSLYSQGVEAYNRDDFDTAFDLIKAAYELEPNSIEINNILGAVHYAKGDPISALKHFLNAIKINPLNADAIANCAKLLSSLGHHEEANYYYSMLNKAN
ncbi:sulfotransferase family 2 domain-containing protein [bacterium]|nr:sulfotransferase family 2 domain-containing protein [bacterium]